MSLIGKEERFGDRIHGTIGRFSSSAGEINYLMAKARLGETGEINQERRLTEHLHPVRELLPVESLGFSQLLQRDLDDARVASELIPYLLRQRSAGPAFFPPVTAMLLPFRDKQPDGSFPSRRALETVDESGTQWQRSTYGPSFAVDVLLGPDGEPAWPSLGRILWSKERAKLVVLDGQHRAMALLAIFRTLNDSWENSEYRVFYKDAVGQLLDDVDRSFLSEVELPVTICWAPDAPDPHKIARALFVDLNLNARTPSPSRLLLLDETRLLSLFVRRVLDEVKSGSADGRLSLACIEYDSPDEARRGPLRWSALTNLEIVKSAVEKLLYGPDDVITTMAAKPIRQGRKNDGLMRASLWLDEILPAELDDDGRTFAREEIRDAHWPRTWRQELSDRFWATWGESLALILGELLPHRAHIAALDELRHTWRSDDAESALVFRAIFEGTGLYWSLADSKEVETDEIERRWRTWFEAKRAEIYLGTDTDVDVAHANEALNVSRLIACQLGLLLAYRTLAKKVGWRPGHLLDGARSFVGAINASLEAGAEGYGRRLAMVRGSGSLNMLEKLDANDAPSFKYFWMELAALDDGGHLVDDAHAAVVALAAEGRRAYWETLTRQRHKTLQVVHPEADEVEIAARARATTAANLYRALRTALHLSDEVAREMMLALPGLEEEMLESRAAQEGEVALDELDVDELDETQM